MFLTSLCKATRACYLQNAELYEKFFMTQRQFDMRLIDFGLNTNENLVRKIKITKFFEDQVEANHLILD